MNALLKMELVVASLFLFSCRTPSATETELLNQNLDVANIKLIENIGLHDGYEVKKKDEDSIISFFINEFTKKQKRVAEKNQGEIKRGTHSKGTCFDGSVETNSYDALKNLGYDDDTSKMLKQGIFSIDTVYPTQIRFSNGEGLVQADNVTDVRGFSLSLDLDGKFKTHSNQSRQDFISNNSKTFPTKDLQDFVPFFKSVVLAETKNPVYIPGPAGAIVVAKSFKQFGQYLRKDSKSYANESYWSNVPAVHGLGNEGRPMHISRFRLSPCSKKLEKIDSKGKDDSYLQKQIVDDVSKERVCFNFQFQFFDQEKLAEYFSKNVSPNYKKWKTSDWIENSGDMIWPESVLPYYTVAQIYIPTGASPVDCTDRYVNSRLHSSPHHTPIGSLARGRAVIEEASRQFRMSRVER